MMPPAIFHLISNYSDFVYGVVMLPHLSLVQLKQEVQQDGCRLGVLQVPPRHDPLGEPVPLIIYEWAEARKVPDERRICVFQFFVIPITCILMAVRATYAASGPAVFRFASIGQSHQKDRKHPEPDG